MQRASQPDHGTKQEAKWLKLLPPAVKCTVDSALFNNNTWLLHRDSSRQLGLGMSEYAFFSSLPLETEALGLLEAIKLVIARGFPSIKFESDYKLVVDAINSSRGPQNEVGDIISRCPNLLSSHIHFIVGYVRRQTNKIAHSIARVSLSDPNLNIFYYVPSYLYHLIINQMA